MSDLAKDIDDATSLMEENYKILEGVNPESPLLKLVKMGSSGLVFTNEFLASYPTDVYDTPRSAQLAYAEDLEDARWKAEHPSD